MPDLVVEVRGGVPAARVTRAVEAGLERLITDLTLLVEREARVGAPKDTGALARSIAGRVQGLTGRVGTNLVYAPVMEFGRAPGARMPPPAALAGWARRHGLTGPGATYVLARAIARRGIAGRFFMRQALDRARQALPGLMAAAARAIAAAWR